MKAAIYIRVSTDDQYNEGFSISAQKERCISFIQSQDWEISEIYIDGGFSAKDLNRPGMRQMIEELKNNKFDVVIVYKLDRLSRSVLDLHELLQLFDKHNVKFKSVTEVFDTTTAMGRFFITLVGAMAAWEREMIAERVRFGMEQMVNEGKRPGGPIPYGYDPNMQIIEEEAETIRQLRKLYMDGNGFRLVAKLLNEQGLFRRGQMWTSFTVYYVLDNPFYAGKLRWGSKKKDGKYANRKKEEFVDCIYQDSDHPPIFTWEEYLEHTSRMKKRSFRGYTKVREYWFAGVLKCGRCGSAMTGRYHQNKRKDGSYHRILSYICSNRQTGKTCDMPMFRQELVEKLVLKYIEDIKIDHQKVSEMAKKEKREYDNLTKEINRLKRELNKVGERKKKWQYMFVEDLISSKDLKERVSEEEQKEAMLMEELSALEKKIGTDKTESMNMMFTMSDLWSVLDDKEKNDMVQTIFKTIELDTTLEGKAHGRKFRFIPAFIKSIEYN